MCAVNFENLDIKVALFDLEKGGLSTKLSASLHLHVALKNQRV